MEEKERYRIMFFGKADMCPCLVFKLSTLFLNTQTTRHRYNLYVSRIPSNTFETPF